MGAELITVSTDTEFVHLAWKNSEGELADVKYPMGSDPTGNLARTFGVYARQTDQDEFVAAGADDLLAGLQSSAAAASQAPPLVLNGSNSSST